MDPAIPVTETIASGSAFAGAAACSECLTSFGMDPTIAGAAAVLLGVGVRLFADWAIDRYRQWREARAALPAPAPAPKTPDT